ncbi:Uncharacterised protein [Aeromonas hydrophila]|nr:Uncharacterised protein [Aeromonas hydrophila]
MCHQAFYQSLLIFQIMDLFMLEHKKMLEYQV